MASECLPIGSSITRVGNTSTSSNKHCNFQLRVLDVVFTHVHISWPPTDFKMHDFVPIGPDSPLESLSETHPWLLQEKLVVKPDQLIKRRGKADLIALNRNWPEVMQWVNERRGKEVKVEQVSGILDHFLVEPFIPHKSTDEYYVCITTNRYGEEILFHHEGGVDIGDVDSKVLNLPPQFCRCV